MNKNVGAGLGIGIFLVPLIFGWFVLRQGYSTVARVITVIWMIISVWFAMTLILGQCAIELEDTQNQLQRLQRLQIQTQQLPKKEVHYIDTGIHSVQSSQDEFIDYQN